MKFLKVIFSISVTLAGLAISANAQAAPAQATPAKVGFVNSAAFSNQTAGITRFVNALKTLDNEFLQRRTEITQLVARLEELQKVPPGTTEAQLEVRRDQAQTLQVDVTRKQEDARTAYTKRFAQLTDPIQKSIVDSLRVFARSRGIDVLIDISKFPEGVLLVNENVDLTTAFIRDFNAKNP
jgi:Skp family chaperone for outer membrane proteins